MCTDHFAAFSFSCTCTWPVSSSKLILMFLECYSSCWCSKWNIALPIGRWGSVKEILCRWLSASASVRACIVDCSRSIVYRIGHYLTARSSKSGLTSCTLGSMRARLNMACRKAVPCHHCFSSDLFVTARIWLAQSSVPPAIFPIFMCLLPELFWPATLFCSLLASGNL